MTPFTLAEAIRAIRARLAENQTNFGKRLGCSQGRLSDFESGQRQPGPTTLMKLKRLALTDAERWPIAEALRDTATLRRIALPSAVRDVTLTTIDLLGEIYAMRGRIIAATEENVRLKEELNQTLARQREEIALFTQKSEHFAQLFAPGGDGCRWLQGLLEGKYPADKLARFLTQYFASKPIDHLDHIEDLDGTERSL